MVKFLKILWKVLLIAAAVYAALVLAMGIIRRQALESLPNGGKIADLLHIR